MHSEMGKFLKEEEAKLNMNTNQPLKIVFEKLVTLEEQITHSFPANLKNS